MPAVCVMDQVRSTNVDAMTFLRVIATAMETKKTPWAFAVVIALLMQTTTTSATMWTTALEPSTPAEFAMAQAPFSNAVAQKSLPVIATVTVTKKTPLASAEEPAQQMQTATAFVTT